MVEILNTAGFELIDGGDLDLEEQIETMKIDYGEQGKLSKAVQKVLNKIELRKKFLFMYKEFLK